VLYAFGLLGDSYYGIAAAVPGLSVIYDLFFNVFSYTRNGIFLRRFFSSSVRISARARGTEVSKAADAQMQLYLYKKSAIVKDLCCLASAICTDGSRGLLLEVICGCRRHDSMYIMLPVCLIFCIGCSFYAAETNEIIVIV